MIGVIGATGHLGNNLVRELVKKGYEVTAIIPEGENLEPLIGIKLDIRYADIRNYNSIYKAIEGCDKVFHIAGIVSISQKEWNKLYEVNVLGTRNVVNACIERGVQRLVYTSSIHALREPPKGNIITEKLSFQPQYGDYAKSKALATNEVFEGIKKGLDAVIICPTGVIGPYDYKISEIGTLLMMFARRKIVFYIDGEYDFVDARDVAYGHILAMEKGKKGEVYILSGEKITVRNMLNIINNEFREKRTLVRIPFFIAKFAAFFASFARLTSKEKPLFTNYSITVLQSNCDISSEKARRQLSFVSRSVKDSLRDSVIWFREKGYIS